MRSLAVRLALLMLAIVAAAIVAVYAYVVPPLAAKLRTEEEQALAQTATAYAPEVERAIASSSHDPKLVAAAVRTAADQSGARTTLLKVTHTGGTLRMVPSADSTGATGLAALRFPMALEAASSGRVVSGSTPTPAGHDGDAAVPLFVLGDAGRPRVAYTLVFSKSLADVERNVALVRRRFLLAGAIAIIVATLAGVAVAISLRRRIERLRLAARAIARGDFSARVDVSARDEIGRLALELDDMRRQLAQLDEARSRFIATASHELRTPIFSLAGFLELLADEDVDEETRAEFLEQLRGQVGRLQTLATGLLDLSRLESGALELHPELVDVGALARAVVAEFRPALAGHGSALDLHLDHEPLRVAGDPDRLAQILRILIDNALVHTPAGTRVTVSAGHEPTGGPGPDGLLRVTVQDFGSGIREAELTHVFDPFYTSDDAQGAGLGLAIARELAERMQGTLVAASAAGTTTFTLEVPA